MSGEPPSTAARPSFETLIGRAMRLRCPRCGEGRLFSGWVRMPERCRECRLKFERAPGYFLGSTYINYAITAVSLTIAYMVLHFGFDLSNRQLAWPLAAFCVIFPILSFRYARALWLAIDCHIDRSILEDQS